MLNLKRINNDIEFYKTEATADGYYMMIIHYMGGDTDEFILKPETIQLYINTYNGRNDYMEFFYGDDYYHINLENVSRIKFTYCKYIK